MINENTQFAAAFQALRTQAKAHNLDPNTEDMRRFLVHVAKVMADKHIQLIKAETITHGLK